MPKVFPLRICRPFTGPQLPGVGGAAFCEHLHVFEVVVVEVDVDVVVVQVVVGHDGVVDASLASPQLPDGRVPLACSKFPDKISIYTNLS